MLLRVTNSCGLGLVLWEYLVCVCMTRLRFIPHCKELKLLEPMMIYSKLESISLIHISNLVVESDFFIITYFRNASSWIAFNNNLPSFLFQESCIEVDDVFCVPSWWWSWQLSLLNIHFFVQYYGVRELVVFLHLQIRSFPT